MAVTKKTVSAPAKTAPKKTGKDASSMPMKKEAMPMKKAAMPMKKGKGC